jgi:hypothetical protein
MEINYKDNIEYNNNHHDNDIDIFDYDDTQIEDSSK